MTLETEIRRDVDNYEQTIGALLAVAQHTTFQYSAKPWFGRKFVTSASNKVSPNEDVTPDLSIQFNHNYGLVVEAKKNFARPDDYDDGITQAKKYDDALTGWQTPTGTINSHDVALLTHTMRSTALEERLKDRRTEFSSIRKVAIVEFTRSDELNAYFVLKRIGEAKLSHSALDEKLRYGISVKIDNLIPAPYCFSEIKFYDAEPPVAHTMKILWDNVFSEMPSEDEYRQAAGKKKIEIMVTIDDLCERLKQFAPRQEGERVPEIPKRAWVERALNMFVEIKLAKPVRTNKRIEPGKYIVSYHKFKKGDDGNGSLECFIPKIAESMRQQRLA